MAENKQYVTQVQENGTVLVSEDVIISIVEHAVLDVEGVAGISSIPGTDIAELISKNWGKGMRVQIAEDNSVTVGCNINITYGSSVVDVAQNVQNSVTTAVESMAGVQVKAVNVNVCGILRK